MSKRRNNQPFVVEPDGENRSEPCPCCGNRTHTVWGYIHQNDATLAVYYVRWTPGHLDRGASVELLIGDWGEESKATDRQAVLLRYGVTAKGAGFMVVDAEAPASDDLVGKALKRKEVVGTPLAEQAFALADAIWLKEKRIAEIRMWPKRLH
jgi:hypothetical protein